MPSKLRLITLLLISLSVLSCTKSNNSAEIAGPDKNSNGVRDDLDEWIQTSYPNSEKTRAVLMEYSRELQSAIINIDDKAKASEHILRLVNARLCANAVLNVYDPSDGRNMFNLLRAKQLNTYDLSKRYMKANAYLSGKIIHLQTGAELETVCHFSYKEMKN